MKYLIAISINSILLISCGKQNALKDEISSSSSAETVVLTDEQYKAAGITLGKIQKQKMSTSIHVNGRLDVPPQNMITISAPLGGFVKATNLLQGMKVRKGDLLVTLENMEYIQLQQDYIDSKSKLNFLEAEYNRQVELSKENVNATKTLQQSKSQYESTRAMVNALEAKLSMINITPASLAQGAIKPTVNLYSPTNGFVTQVHVNLGQFVNATDVMFKLVNLDHIHAEIQVYEKDVNKISVGQKVTFQLANVNTTYHASVYLIGKEISSDGIVNVHCHLDSENSNFLPGMFITANIQATESVTEVLPTNAIVNHEGNHFVFVMVGKNQFKMTPVHLGNSNDQFTELILGPDFDKNNSIALTGAFELMGVLKNTEEE